MNRKVSTYEAVRLLHDGTRALTKMEANGMRIDVAYLNKAIEDTKQEITNIEKELKADELFRKWKKIFKDKTNINSNDQLAHLVYQVLKYPCTVFTATGKPKTDKTSLKKIDVPFVQTYFKKKELDKTLSTYLLNYQREHVDGILHPSFNFNPESFRSGCSLPNVQNVPSRSKEIVKLLRQCFIPRKGNVITEIDFGQIEVRVAACYHKDANMLKYIKDPKTDMHRDTAMDLFMIPIELVEKKTTRDWTKNRFVFPEFYGSVYFQCAPNIWKAVEDESNKLPNGKSVLQHLKEKGIKSLGLCDPKQKPVPGTFEHHVKSVEDVFWQERFPEYTEWKDRWWRNYCKTGGYRMLTGFYVRGLYKRNEVLNYGIQGASFHCLLWSIVQLQRELEKRKMRTMIINEIHDCVVADVPREEIQDYLYLAREIMVDKCMANFPWLIVPLEVEAEVAESNWFEKRVWSDKSGKWALAS